MDTITVTNAQGRSVSVEYDWEQGRFAGCSVFDSSDAPIFARTVTRAPRRPALVTAITNAGFEPLTSNLSSRTFSYAYDAVGRPVERGGDAFAYNARGEVTNATIDSAAWSYAYDHIGNRTTASDSAGTTAYAANAVNQYTAVDSWTPSYDLDGNLLGDGSLGYAWDAAGRLASARDPNAWRGDPWWSFEYDHRGRRVMKRNWTVLGNWSAPDGHSVYFYDGWNLVHEIRVSGSYQTSHVDYFWGPDLSGTLQGAGGVGGLVAVSVDGDFYFPGYDNNGNVVGYWDESGSLVAEYSYDAFGNTLSSSGSMASVFPHRFSTKYYDSETDLYYYGYRYYAPALGRWISRDPICERGGANLYSSFGNDAVWRIDLFGLLVQVIEAAEPVPMTDAERKNAPDVVIPDGIKKVEEFLREFYTISLQDFDRSVRNGCVKFNGETFTGSRIQYWFKVLTEKFSSYSLNTSSDLDAFANIVKQKARLVTQPHDRLVVTAHGLDESDTEGNPVDEAKVGEKWYERAVLYPKLETAAGTARDKLIIISCYSTWNPKEQLAKETVESVNIISPICKPIRESAKSRPSARSFVIEFTPFQAFRFIGRNKADENY